jgi:hypothetical protein
VAVLFVLVALVLAVVVVVPVLLFGVELIIVGVVIALGIIGRLVLGRPWIVVAESAAVRGVGFAWKVSGWRGSGRVIGEVADAIESGLEPGQLEVATRTALPRHLL